MLGEPHGKKRRAIEIGPPADPGSATSIDTISGQLVSPFTCTSLYSTTKPASPFPAISTTEGLGPVTENTGLTEPEAGVSVRVG